VLEVEINMIRSTARQCVVEVVVTVVVAVAALHLQKLRRIERCGFDANSGFSLTAPQGVITESGDITWIGKITL
jgi:hypothetical protein